MPIGRGEEGHHLQVGAVPEKKALLANAGLDGEPYPNFEPFSPKEVHQHLGLYILHGLLRPPRVDMNFFVEARPCEWE